MIQKLKECQPLVQMRNVKHDCLLSNTFLGTFSLTKKLHQKFRNYVHIPTLYLKGHVHDFMILDKISNSSKKSFVLESMLLLTPLHVTLFFSS